MSAPTASHEVTRLLVEWRQGREGASGQGLGPMGGKDLSGLTVRL